MTFLLSKTFISLVLVGARLPSANRLLVHVVGVPSAPRSGRRLLPSLEERREVRCFKGWAGHDTENPFQPRMFQKKSD